MQNLTYLQSKELFNKSIENTLNGAQGKEMVLCNKSNSANSINFNDNLFYEQYKLWDKFKKDTDRYETLWESIKDKFYFDKFRQLNDFKHDSSSLIDNLSKVNEKKSILDSFSRNKPLGEYGDVTLNDFIVNGKEILLPIIEEINNHVDIRIGLGVISAFFMYKWVVKTYIRTAFGNDPVIKIITRSSDTRSKEIAVFMILGAPMIVGSI